MLSESHPLIRRAIRFLLLPYCFLRLVDWSECTKSRLSVALDFLYVFFVLRDFPDNYGPCRLWEVPRSQWGRYFGSNYNPVQKALLRKEVNPLPIQIIYTDKHACDLVCRGLALPIPDLLGVLDPGRGYREQLQEIFSRVDDERVIIKPVRGHAGLGVHVAVRSGSEIRLIAADGSIADLPATPTQEKFVVQRMLAQVSPVASIAPNSINTVRVVTLLTRDSTVLLVAASMRFGVGRSLIDNWSAGGVAVGVDTDSGTLMETAFDKRGKRYQAHPESGCVFRGFQIPHWPAVITLSERVQRGLPFNRLLGLDIALTPHGPVLIEINPDTDLVFQEQTSGPLFQDKIVWRAFRDYGLLYNTKQRALFSA